MNVINNFLQQSNDLQMKMQMLQIPTVSDTEKIEKLETYLGMAHGFSDPFNLFINIDDIEQNRNLIYFFSYSMGKKRTIIWGTYDKNLQDITIQAGCRFDSWKYIDYLNGWKNMDYQIYDTITVNRFVPLINKYTSHTCYTRNPREINTITDYKIWTYILQTVLSQISEYELALLFNRLDVSDLSYTYNPNSILSDFKNLLVTQTIKDIIPTLTSQIKIFNKNKLSINNEYDLKAWTYMMAYYNDKITKNEVNFLFSKLPLSELSYDYKHYKNADSILADFYDILGINDFMDDYEIQDIIDDAVMKISDFEMKDLNYIDDRSPKRIKDIIMIITKLFVDRVSRSKYVLASDVNRLESCPQSKLECSNRSLHDPNDKCAVFIL